MLRLGKLREIMKSIKTLKRPIFEDTARNGNCENELTVEGNRAPAAKKGDEEEEAGNI